MERCMIQPSVCGEWKGKKWKIWGCQQVIKKYKCLQKKKKEKKNHRHNKNKSWHCARKKKKEVEKNKNETNTRVK